MFNLIYNKYFKHPSEVNMTYTEHFKHSMYFSYLFLDSGIKAFIHAIMPEFFKTSTTDVNIKITKLLKSKL
jgi:hypothetical protein|uniref:Capsule biosynthesis protein n=1 Tax=viral metagenome TaxID=1070528 RepID=A0A6C0C0T1_9ZZZZ